MEHELKKIENSIIVNAASIFVSQLQKCKERSDRNTEIVEFSEFWQSSLIFFLIRLKLYFGPKVGVRRAVKFQFRAEPSQKVSEPDRAELFMSFFYVILTSQAKGQIGQIWTNLD